MNRLSVTLTRVLESIAAVLLLAIAAIVVAQVFLRYGRSESITGANEMITILFIYMSTIGAAVAVGRWEHIAITMAVDSFSPAASRALRVFAIACVAFLNAALVFYSVGWIRITGNFLMPTTELPRRVVQLSVPVGCTLAVLLCACLLLESRRAQSEPIPSRSASE